LASHRHPFPGAVTTMTSLPVCSWRGELRQERYLCRSAKFLGAPNWVQPEACGECPYADHLPAPPPPPALPCVHLGGVEGTNGKGPGLFACALHGRCSPAWDDVGMTTAVPRCVRCPDYLPRDPFGPDSARMRRRADAFLAAVPDYPAGRYQSRGVVIVGGERYFASLYVTIRALRRVGCRLPIQVWYFRRRDEMPADRQALLAAHGVECVDADEVREHYPARRLGGWELKVFAALHSPFEEILFLDADCYPCRNPEFLFDLADYRELGAVFWPDAMPIDHRLKWPAFGVPDPHRPGSVESGQFVLNKRACWRPLNLTWFYNDHSDFYYRYCYGDKHTFEVAWARCGRPFVMWDSQARWQDGAYLHTGPDGLPLFVHRCGDKFRLKPESFTTPQPQAGAAFSHALPLEAECWGWLGELALALGPGARREPAAPLPQKVVRVGLPGRFNCSVLEHQGRLLVASRRGETGARLDLSELGADFQPRWTRPLELGHRWAETAHEDPRLFHFRGRLHCAFLGATWDGRDWHVNQLVCRIGDDYRVEDVWLPEYADRTPVEKNWQFFEHEGELYSIYSVSPHVILHHCDRRAKKFAETPARLHWPGCYLRGGAPPVRVGDEYYHFFHSVDVRRAPKVYSMGLYTFEARPPFAVRRVAAGPILSPDDYDWPPHLIASVVFPCGAVLRDGRWLISYGYHDYECRVAVFAADDLERRLREV
jgi:predicted GH43/DUF377 family glycosyl hydrolase